MMRRLAAHLPGVIGLAVVIFSLFAATASPTPATTGGAETIYQSGNADFRNGDTRAAEKKYRQALEIDPGHIGALLQLAKVVSWFDRHEESIGIYEEALSLDPGNIQGRLGLAKVESWTADFGRAMEIYEKILEEHPGHHEAGLGLAETLAFAGRTAESRELYRRLLERSPDGILARNGLARTLSWEGRLEEALSLYQASIEQEPRNAEALAGRARVYLWQGRTPQAWEAFSAASGINPGHREVLELREALDDRFASNLRVRAGVMVDSDDNVIDSQRATFTFTPLLSTTVAVIYNRTDATQPCARLASAPCDVPDPNSPGSAKYTTSELATRVETVKGQVSWRWKPDLTLSGSAGIDRVDRERDQASTIVTGSAGADWRMNDRWHFSGAVAKETFAATALTLDRGVRLLAKTATAAWTPLSRLGTRLTLQQMDLSDGNGRRLVSGFVRWSVPVARPRVALTWNGRLLSYDEPETGRENGYFAPDSFLANIAGVEVSDRIGDRIGLSASTSLGIQQVRVVGGAKTNRDTVRGYSLRGSYDLTSRLSLEAWFGRTNLALQGPTGFTATETGVALRWKTGWPAPGYPGSGPGPGGGEPRK